MTRIYLVRHAKAIKTGYQTDEERWLTDRGRADAEAIAAQIAKSGVTVHQIRHSGLVRAEQTAEIFARHLNPPGGVIPVSGLHYGDPVEPLARELHLEPAPVMLVGHSPFMEKLVSAMLRSSTGTIPVWFTTSCTVCLEYVEDAWSVRWALNREIVPAQ